MRLRFNLGAFVFFLLIVGLSGVSALNPSGANVTLGDSSSAPEHVAGSVPAIAGNVTELNIFGYSSTQSWQGYYGNVTGTIQLANNNDDAMYNWSVASPRGEVYAANSSSINWTNIRCFDMENEVLALEEFYNIPVGAVDGVNETFNLRDHPLFYTNNIKFEEGQCYNTKLFGPGGVGNYDEVLLSDGVSVVFTSLLVPGTMGFDGGVWDFQMIVLEDGRGSNIETSTYYFWVELE